MQNKRFRLKKWLLTVLFVSISVVFSGTLIKTNPVSARSGTTTTPGSTVTPPATVTPTTTPKGEVSVGLPLPGSDKTSYKQWNVYLTDFFKFAEIIGVSLGVLMIIWAGYLYMFSGGDSTKMNTAKEYILGAIIGLALLYLINYLTILLNICNINGHGSAC